MKVVRSHQATPLLSEKRGQTERDTQAVEIHVLSLDLAQAQRILHGRVTSLSKAQRVIFRPIFDEALTAAKRCQERRQDRQKAVSVSVQA